MAVANAFEDRLLDFLERTTRHIERHLAIGDQNAMHPALSFEIALLLGKESLPDTAG